MATAEQHAMIEECIDRWIEVPDAFEAGTLELRPDGDFDGAALVKVTIGPVEATVRLTQLQEALDTQLIQESDD